MHLSGRDGAPSPHLTRQEGHMLGGLACGCCQPMSLPLWAEWGLPFLPPSTMEVGFPFFPPFKQSPVRKQPLQKAYLVPTPLPADTFTRVEQSADWPHYTGACGAGKRQAQTHWPSLLCVPAPSCRMCLPHRKCAQISGPRAESSGSQTFHPRSFMPSDAGPPWF